MKVKEWLRRNTIPLSIGLALVAGLGLSVGAAWLTGYCQGLVLNLGTEVIGAVATYLLFAWLIGRRELKRDLIARMGSRVHDVAIAAVEELRRYGWLTDGSLRGAILVGAKLEGAILVEANLEHAHLGGADLRGAFLRGANLQRALLVEAHLHHANLTFANLQKADLQKADLGIANLQNADLTEANLKGALLSGTNLEGAILRQANLEEVDYNPHVTLPDGTKWTPDTDMARFTDPDHSDFWRTGT
jgi:hypothetical protein